MSDDILSIDPRRNQTLTKQLSNTYICRFLNFGDTAVKAKGPKIYIRRYINFNIYKSK